jgi:hypothetical protein
MTAFPCFYVILDRTHPTFSVIDFPAHSSWMKIGVAEDLGLSSQIVSIGLSIDKSIFKPLSVKYFVRNIPPSKSNWSYLQLIIWDPVRLLYPWDNSL